MINTIFLLLTAIALYFAFRSLDVGAVVQAFGHVTKGHFLAACMVGLLYICMEGIMLYLLKGQVGERQSLPVCLRYSFVGFFYSGITPSATGGQPMQLLWMMREGSTAGSATVILLVIAVLYRFSSVVYGVFCAIGQKYILGTVAWKVQISLWLGLLLNILFILLVLLAILKPGWILSVADGLGKIIFRRQEEKRRAWQQKVRDFVDQYKMAGVYIARQKKMIFGCFLLTMFQRLLQFMVLVLLILPYQTSLQVFAKLIYAKAYIVMSVEMLPLPGSQGITELTSLQILQNVIADSGMQSEIVLERMTMFYVPLLCAGGIILLNLCKGRGRCYTYRK